MVLLQFSWRRGSKDSRGQGFKCLFPASQDQDSDMSEIDNHEFINIAILENIIEAQLIDSILNEQNIPHMIRSFYDTAYDGLFQFQMGWGELCAPPFIQTGNN